MVKKVNGRKRQKNNLFFCVVGIISTIISICFCISLFLLDMLPIKYLIIIYIFIFVIFSVLLYFTFSSKVKRSKKVLCFVIFTILALLMGVGIKYIMDTINFVGVINNEMYQMEEYYVMVLNDSKIKKVNELENKDVGIYSTDNSSKAISVLGKKVVVNDKEFDDVTKMFDSLKNNDIEAVVINSSIKSMLRSEFEDIGLELREIYKFSVAIKKRDIVKTVDVTKDSFNVYIAGGDSYGTIDSVTNTDVNMVISVNPKKREALLTSIPRDYYVNLPSFGEQAYDKLTHVGYYGIQESVSAVENLLDTDINYYVKVNFSTIEGVIDAIGGVDVYSDYAFKERAFKKYYYVKGNNHLNGEQALAFARERKAFSEGDVQRVKNQQKVLTAIINKVSTSTSLITNYSEILDSISSNFSTNLSRKSINKLVKMQLDDMRGWSIENQNLVGTDLYTGTYTFPKMEIYVMKQDSESVNSVASRIKDFLEK